MALEDGYSIACGPGSAVVRVKGTAYRIKGGRCFRGPGGARLYFGAFNFTDVRVCTGCPAANNPLTVSSQILLMQHMFEIGLAYKFGQ